MNAKPQVGDKILLSDIDDGCDCLKTYIAEIMRINQKTLIAHYKAETIFGLFMNSGVPLSTLHRNTDKTKDYQWKVLY